MPVPATKSSGDMPPAFSCSRLTTLAANPVALVAFTLVLVICYFGCAFLANSDALYLGIDGSLFTTLYQQLFDWSSPSQPTPINPFQGMGTVYLPYNVWINPGYLVMHWSDNSILQRVASSLVFLTELFASIVLLSRAFRIKLVPSLLIALGACVATFANPWCNFDMPHQLSLNPGVAHHIALDNIMLALFVWLGQCGKKTNIAIAVVLPALWIYSIACDPMWHAVVCLPYVFFTGAVLCCSENRQALGWKLAGILLFVAVNLALSVPTYYKGVSDYPVRQLFRLEVYGEIQTGEFASVCFRNKKAFRTFLAFLFGAAALVGFGKSKEKWFAGFTILHLLIMVVVGLVFLLGEVNWTYPLPMYLDFGAYSLYAVVTALGAIRYWEAKVAPLLADRWSNSRLTRNLAAWPTCWRYVVVGLFPVVGLCGLVLTGKVPNSWEQIAAQDAAIRQRVRSSPIVEELRTEIALSPGNGFRGSVVSIYGESGSPLGRHFGKAGDEPYDKWQFANARNYLDQEFGNSHALVDLWRFAIPTLEEYSQLVSPPMYYLMSRTMARPQDYVSRNFLPDVTAPNYGLLAALGVRFVITDRDLSEESMQFHQQLVSKDGIALRLYELPEPNLGNYSPQRVHCCTTAAETVALLRSDDFDFRREVVLYESVSELLVPVRAAQMRYEQGGVHVRAESDGTSLLLLPLQYSHCLTPREAQSDKKNCRLLRANLAQTAILFDGRLDMKLAFDYGLCVNVQARVEDVRDVGRLQIINDQQRKLPPGLHPYAWNQKNRRR